LRLTCPAGPAKTWPAEKSISSGSLGRRYFFSNRATIQRRVRQLKEMNRARFGDTELLHQRANPHVRFYFGHLKMACRPAVGSARKSRTKGGRSIRLPRDRANAINIRRGRPNRGDAITRISKNLSVRRRAILDAIVGYRLQSR